MEERPEGEGKAKEEEPLVIEPEELAAEEGPVEGERLVVEVGPEEEEEVAPRPAVVSPPSFKPVIWRDPLLPKVVGGLIGGLLGASAWLLSGALGRYSPIFGLSLLAALVGAVVVALEGLLLDLKGADVGRLASLAFASGLLGGGLGGLCLFLLGGGGLSAFVGHLLAFGLAGCAVGIGSRRRASASPARWGGIGGLFGLLCGAWAWICGALLEGAAGWALVAVPFGLVVPGGIGLMERLMALLEVRCLSGRLAGARCFVDTPRAEVGPGPGADLPVEAGASVEFEVMPSGIVARPLSGDVGISGGDPARRAAKVGGVWVEAVLRGR